MVESGFKTALRAILADRRSRADAPSPDELLSFREDLLTDEQHDDLLARAAAEPEIARALLDARRFPDIEPADEAQRVSERDLDRQWLRFQEGLNEEHPSGAREGTSDEPPPPYPASLAFLFSARFAQAAAAALLMVSLGLSWALFTQRSPTTDAAEPRLNLPIVELVPESEGGERADGTKLRIPAAADGALLVLALRDRRSFAAYELAIQDPTGQVVWSSTALRRSSEGFFTLEWPRGFLPTNRYRLVITGIDGDRRLPLAIYALAIEGS